METELLDQLYSSSLLEELELYLENLMDSQMTNLELPSSSFTVEDSSDSSPSSAVMSSALCLQEMDNYNLFRFNDLPESDSDVLEQLDHLPPQFSIDEASSLVHLLQAYGEARDGDQEALEAVILHRLKNKASPTGTPLQRLAYYLTLDCDGAEEAKYLKQESEKNYGVALKAFYQIFPYGRFAHFAAGSAILASLPEDVEAVHVVDFDMGEEGLQWPPLIEAFGSKGLKELRISSIIFEDDDNWGVHGKLGFEHKKKRLGELARNVGVRLRVEEMDMGGLVNEMKKGMGSKEWVVFNCMEGLPHMGRKRRRSTRQVVQFLDVAKVFVRNNRGIITSGSGMDHSRFGFGFEQWIGQLEGLLESMEQSFPAELVQARMAMEALFVAPLVSCDARFQDSVVERCCLQDMKLEPWRLSKEILVEAKELVREGESGHWVRSEGEQENRMVLGFMGTPLATVSCWRCS